MYDIQLTETLDITCQDKKKLAIDVVEVLGTRGDSAAIRGIFNLTDDEPNLFFRHGNYVVCFQTIEEYDEYDKDRNNVKDDLAKWNQSMQEEAVDAKVYDDHIRKVWVPLTRGFIEKWTDRVLPDIRYALRTFEFSNVMELTHWPGLNEVVWQWFFDA